MDNKSHRNDNLRKGIEMSSVKKCLFTIILSILLFSSVLMSCSQPLPDSDLGEYKVPDTYTTYTDKNSLFSISYPADWEMQVPYLSVLEDESDSLNEYLNNNESPNIPQSKDTWSLFRATPNAAENNNIYISITAIRLLQGEGTKEQFYNRAMQIVNYHIYLTDTLRIDGKEVAIFRRTSNNGRTIMVTSAVVVDQIVWVTSCAGDSQYEKDFQTIIRSLRVPGSEPSLKIESANKASEPLPDSDLGEYKVPETYTTYTDKNGLFSVSYPSDWIINPDRLSYFEGESDSLYEYLNSNKSPEYFIRPDCPACPPEIPSWRLLIASNNSNASMVVSALSTLGRYPQGATKEEVYNIVMATKDYKPFFQETLRIAGNEVTILQVPNTGEAISIVSVLIVDDIVWGVSCALDGQYEKDFQTIIRSLRVLK